MPRRARERPSPRPEAQLRQDILQYIAAHPAQPLKARALARALHVSDDQYAEFRDLLRTLTAEGRLVLGPGRTLRTAQRASGQLSGIFRATRQGFGFVEVTGRDDLFVPRFAVNGAREGDRVAIRLVRRGRPHAEVTEVLERAVIRWVGVLERRGARHAVLPQGRAAAPLVFIDDPTAKGARVGDLVVVEPLEHTLESEHVRGVILERLGAPSRALTQIRGVVRRFRIPDEFPDAVRIAAQQAAAGFNPDSPGEREDLRDLPTLTIDPDDARDFDDAISIEPLRGGQVRLGVHIADVAHFVRPGDPLDESARQRGNSVYFPGYVVPMLPEVLSNGVCSLQPDQPRFTLTAFITYDGDARVVSERCCASIIRSDARLTYAQASAALEDRPVDLAPAVAALLQQAAALARRIRQRRLAAGMIVLALPEVEIRLNDQGEPCDAAPADTSFSHTLIEMFMVEANEAVSRTLRAAGLDHLRRIHPPPPETALDELARLLIGMNLQPPRALTRSAIRKLLDETRGRPEAPAVNLALLRSLAKASYSPADEEHFALASSDYCHFTSPIRRYPDLVNHRLLRALLEQGGRRRSRETPSDAQLADLGAHTSFTERRAQQAEREARQHLLLMLMAGKIGESFDGLITGVSAAGAYVQISPFLAEGMIEPSDLPGGHWRYDADRLALVESRSGRTLRIGQPVRVTVAAVDPGRQTMRLVPAGSDFVQPAAMNRVKKTGVRTRKRTRKGQ